MSPPSGSGTGKHALLGSLSWPLVACAAVSRFHQRKTVVQWGVYMCVYKVCFPALRSPRNQLVRKAGSLQGTLDVFILIKLSLVVTFKQKQSCGYRRGKMNLPQEQTITPEKDAADRGLCASTGGTELRPFKWAGESIA